MSKTNKKEYEMNMAEMIEKLNELTLRVKHWKTKATM